MIMLGRKLIRFAIARMGFDLGGIVRGLKLKSSRLQTSYFFVQKLKIFIEDLNYMLKLY